MHGLLFPKLCIILLGSVLPTGHIKSAPTTKLNNKKPSNGSKPEQFSTTVTTGGFTSSTPIQECGFFPSFVSPDKVAPSPISILQENMPPGRPPKSAPPTGHLKPALATKLDKRSKLAECNSPYKQLPSPTTEHDNNKPTQFKPVNPIKGSKRLKPAECNSPHPTPSESAASKPAPSKPAPSKPAPSKSAPSKPAPSKPAPSKSAPLKPAPTTKLDNKLAECNSPLSARGNEPSAPPAKRLKLDINTQANPLFNNRDRKTLTSGGWLSDRHMNAAHNLMAQKFPSQHGLQDTLTLDKFDRYQSSNEDFVQLINVAGNHWVCASNHLSPPGIVHVYDSQPSCSINSSSLHRQIAAIMKTENASFTMKHVDVQ